MTPEQQAIAVLNNIKETGSNDKEVAHKNADQVLLDFLWENGHQDIVNAFEEARTAINFHYA